MPKGYYRKRSEATEQERVINWATFYAKDFPELALLHHIPNGGSRNQLEAANLKRQGVKAGVPDLCLPVPRNGKHEKVMLGIYEAEQYHPYNRYKGDFEKFQSDWKNEEYDPGMTFTFKDSEVEVLEVLQEEVDNIDHEAVKKQVAAAEDAQYQKRRKQRQRRKQRASKGSRYHRKFF